ncbi:MAG TPA: hotdog fold domain-containing protein, partial [Thermoanaerobaculia bacterium]|nr:hotdog fold domain-containing protein [Thermoanaerobaculia bacterium]
MAKGAGSPGKAIRDAWERCRRIPAGERLFSWALGRMVPYSGSIGAVVRDLSPGRARVELADRRRVRNHLDSIHAVALMNLAELSTGLALNTALPDDARAILVRLTIEYVKKARGTLTSECFLSPVTTNERREVEVAAEIRDAAGEVVARAAALWLVGP